MALNDVVKPAVGVMAVAAVATVGFAAGYLVARDPQLLRRFARSLAGGIDKISGAIAMSREEIADLWAEVRDDAQHEADFGAAQEAANASAVEAKEPKKATAKRSRKSRGASTRSRTAAKRATKSAKASRRG